MTKNLTRSVDLRLRGEVVAKVVWAWGECTVITHVQSYREPRLDTDNPMAIELWIAAIGTGDPDKIAFLWDDYLEAG